MIPQVLKWIHSFNARLAEIATYLVPRNFGDSLEFLQHPTPDGHEAAVGLPR
jgi:hypothetical protein